MLVFVSDAKDRLLNNQHQNPRWANHLNPCLRNNLRKTNKMINTFCLNYSHTT
ncbi:hypothetical protein X975_10128, partial [Stegodyphus mimosarum]